MKKSLFSLLALLTFTTFAVGASGDWVTDYDKALETAKRENKLVLVDFTGSDWCGWCIRLDKEVFSKKKFQDYAKENLVLLEIDFPQNKPQSDELKRQNQELQQRFGIRGYPTIVVLDSEGNEVGRLGYMRGGPDAFVGELEKLKKS